jgi:glutamine synthetase
MEGYCKTIHIEALTMVDMVKGEIIPACIDYQNDAIKLLQRKKALGYYDSTLEEHLLGNISKLSACLLNKLSELEKALIESKEEREILAQAQFYRNSIFAAMSELRLIVDELETLVARKHWPFPVYSEILFSVI